MMLKIFLILFCCFFTFGCNNDESANIKSNNSLDSSVILSLQTSDVSIECKEYGAFTANNSDDCCPPLKPKKVDKKYRCYCSPDGHQKEEGFECCNGDYFDNSTGQRLCKQCTPMSHVYPQNPPIWIPNNQNIHYHECCIKGLTPTKFTNGEFCVCNNNDDWFEQPANDDILSAYPCCPPKKTISYFDPKNNKQYERCIELTTNCREEGGKDENGKPCKCIKEGRESYYQGQLCCEGLTPVFNGKKHICESCTRFAGQTCAPDNGKISTSKDNLTMCCAKGLECTADYTLDPNPNYTCKNKSK